MAGYYKENQGNGSQEKSVMNCRETTLDKRHDIPSSTSTSTPDQGLENKTLPQSTVCTACLGTKYRCPSGATSGRRPAVMLNCRAWLISFGSARPASRSVLHLTNSSSDVPSLTCLFLSRCSPTVVYGRGCPLRVVGG